MMDGPDVIAEDDGVYYEEAGTDWADEAEEAHEMSDWGEESPRTTGP